MKIKHGIVVHEADRRLAPKLTMENELVARCFTCRDRKKFDAECEKDTTGKKWQRPPRFVYRSGSWRVLTESADCPF